MKVRFEAREMPDGRGLLVVGRRRMAYPSPDQAQAAKDVWRHAVRSFAKGPHAFFGDLDRTWTPSPDEGPVLRMQGNSKVSVRYRNSPSREPFVLSADGTDIGYGNLYAALKDGEKLDRKLAPVASDFKFGKALTYAGLAVGSLAGGGWFGAAQFGVLAAAPEAALIVAGGGVVSFSGAGIGLTQRAKVATRKAVHDVRGAACRGDPGYELLDSEPQRVEVTKEEPEPPKPERPRPDTDTPKKDAASEPSEDFVEAPGQDAFLVNLRATVECEASRPKSHPKPGGQDWRAYDVDCYPARDGTRGTLRCETTIQVAADTPEEAVNTATAQAPALQVPGWQVREKTLWADASIDVDLLDAPQIAV